MIAIGIIVDMELVYGPVKSLRYGSTLGINLLGPSKVCSYNCVYCHLGPTELTMNKIRKDYVFPTLDKIKAAFRVYNKKSVTSNAIVISGNGEPTLYPQFEEAVQLILELRNEHMPGTKVICLSSGAHLDSKKVVSGLNLLDERVIKVDAGSDNLLQKINAPLVRINMSKFLSGVRKLNDCVVQALFVDGEVTNTSQESLDEWIEVIGMIKPKSIQLCTLTRPGFNPAIRAVEDDVLYGIAFKLKKRTSLESHVFTAQKA
jgi:wyosine [tRNA(Phe)-imidazoG37] synthetase (radical SAM superfamily)